MELTKNHLNNLKNIFKNKDISLLNKPTYQYLNLLSGFIAHYDLYGFQDYYKDLRDLIRDLKSCDYGMDIKILDLIKVYENDINEYFGNSEKQTDILIIKNLANKHNLNLKDIV